MPSKGGKRRKKSSTLDDQMWSLVRHNPNLGVAWYLMASYAYYELDDPFLSDAAFDGLAKYLLQRWRHIRHWHKHLITEDDLRAGSLKTRDFPEITKGATLGLIQRR